MGKPTKSKAKALAKALKRPGKTNTNKALAKAVMEKRVERSPVTKAAAKVLERRVAEKPNRKPMGLKERQAMLRGVTTTPPVPAARPRRPVQEALPLEVTQAKPNFEQLSRRAAVNLQPDLERICHEAWSQYTDLKHNEVKRLAKLEGVDLKMVLVDVDEYETARLYRRDPDAARVKR